MAGGEAWCRLALFFFNDPLKSQDEPARGLFLIQILWQYLDMSRLSWPNDIKFDQIDLTPDVRTCAHCGGPTYVSDHRHRYLRSLGRPLHLVIKVCCRPDKTCAGHAEKRGSEEEMLIAPPYWSMSWDLFAWIGHRRFSRH